MRPLLFSRSCLWFLPPSTVEKSRSQRAEESRSGRPRADRDRCARAAGRKVAEGSLTSRLLSLSTARSREQSENVYENKGQVQKSLVAQTAGSAVCGFSMIAVAGRGSQTRRSALHQNRGNKARMSMKTKDEVKKLRSRGVEELRGRRQEPTQSPSHGLRNAGWLLNSSTARLLNYNIEGTKRECL
jgi:hypothetical protein